MDKYCKFDPYTQLMSNNELKVYFENESFVKINVNNNNNIFNIYIINNNNVDEIEYNDATEKWKLKNRPSEEFNLYHNNMEVMNELIGGITLCDYKNINEYNDAFISQFSWEEKKDFFTKIIGEDTTITSEITKTETPKHIKPEKYINSLFEPVYVYQQSNNPEGDTYNGIIYFNYNNEMYKMNYEII